MKCQKCHSDNPDTSKYCGSCAAALPSQDQPGPSLTKTVHTPVGLSAGILIAGKYRILDELGRGGMGVVYKAEDVRLQRPVALKFLPHQWVSDPDARERFIQEARAASALDHPNVCTIHEIGETDDGRMYIAMGYYEGESLREKVQRGPLKPDEAVDVARQVAQGLAKAHEKGIVHRDIKPANILITKDGVAKVVDFGLAKLAGQVKLTREGTTVGTVAYMSPEQARGEAVDRRTDIWSLGVVLYEMLSGVLPFKGDYEQTLIHSILQHEPERLAKLRKDLPPGLENVVFKALSKKPAGRYQTMEEMLGDLKAIADGLAPVSGASLLLHGRVLGVKKVHAYPALLGIVILAVLAALAIFPKRGQAFDSIAVLPIENVSGDPAQEPFLYGVHQDLISQLSKVKAFKKVIDKNTMVTFSGTKKKSSEIARELKVSAIVSASAARAGNKVSIKFEVIDGPNNRQIGDGRFEGEYRDILSLEGQAAAAIAQKIQIGLTPAEATSLTRKRPVDPQAYEAYQKGMFSIGGLDSAADTKPVVLQAVSYFEQALKLDPNFAPAYAGLAWVYDNAVLMMPEGEAWAKARQAAEKALSMDASLSLAHVVLADAKTFAWDFEGADTEFKRVLDLDPNSAHGHLAYAVLLAVLGRADQALVHGRRALELDPFTLNTNSAIIMVLNLANDVDGAIRLTRQALTLFPNNLGLREQLAYLFYMKGLFDAARSEYREIKKLGPLTWPLDRTLDFLLSGDRSKTREFADSLLKEEDEDPWGIAQALVLLGDRERAVEWMAKCVKQRNGGAVFMRAFYEEYKTDPQYRALLKQVGLEK